jgi:hypothetical protein
MPYLRCDMIIEPKGDMIYVVLTNSLLLLHTYIWFPRKTR